MTLAELLSGVLEFGQGRPVRCGILGFRVITFAAEQKGHLLTAWPFRSSVGFEETLFWPASLQSQSGGRNGDDSILRAFNTA